MTLWENNHVQFARLLAEIVATQEKLDTDALCASMDLTPDELDELLDRAQASWESYKNVPPALAPRSSCEYDLSPDAGANDGVWIGVTCRGITLNVKLRASDEGVEARIWGNLDADAPLAECAVAVHDWLDSLDAGDECPLCHNGTVEIVDGEVRCQGECGSCWPY